MYKLLLCWRYLRTRYLALVCITSIMLGVATLIVVNAVMAGFSTKLKERLHGLLSDVVLESANGFGSFDDPKGKMEHIRKDPVLNEKIEAMTATVEVFAMLQFNSATGSPFTRPVRLIGIEPEGRARVGGFSEFLVNPRNRADPSKAFALDEEASRRYRFHHPERAFTLDNKLPRVRRPGEIPDPEPPEWHGRPHAPAGVIIGYAIGHQRLPRKNVDDPPQEICNLYPGDSIVLATVSGAKLAPVYDRFVITDYCKTEMSEYDSNYVYVPLDHLQKLRAMDDHVSGIQIKLKEYADAPVVVDRLRKMFDPNGFEVQTWEDKQGPLLAAIRVEKGILNVLLFMIIAVAGFGVLAIFSMIVVEKTRDIGILKALGASNVGVMKIFLGYGLLLGLVGAGLGTSLGIAFTEYINEIEKVIARMTGQEIFPRGIYYFDKIPTDLQPLSLILVNAGAVAIAVLFSILPALRAAMLHPVRALRYE